MLLLSAQVVVKGAIIGISRFCFVFWFFTEDYTKLLLSACRTCGTLIFPRSTNQIRELKQPRQRRQQQRHLFAYFTMKNNSFACFARAFFIFGHLADILDLSTTWNHLFCNCVDDVSIWWPRFNFVFLTLKRCFQFNSSIVRTHFAREMTLNNWEMIEETRSYIFSWRSRCRIDIGFAKAPK